MTTGEAKPSTTRSLTPLWVVSLFVSLTETVLGIGVIQTTGGIQIALTVFVMIFPLLIAGAFFGILWHKPYVFYSPSEYAQQDVRQYVEAMQSRSRIDSKLFPELEHIVRSQLSSSEVVAELTETISRRAGDRVEGQIAKILTSVADRTVESIKDENFLTVDSRKLVGVDGDIWRIPYSRYVTVSELLDNVWFLLEPYGTPSMQYGVIWALRDKRTGTVLKDMGRTWARKQGKIQDGRTLSQVGITPGMYLEAVPLK
ncbi:MAG TPA: hypothetical protein VF735_08890 [Pyrinomonadaceae bacterium]|jgi:hypothetical protein